MDQYSNPISWISIDRTDENTRRVSRPIGGPNDCGIGRMLIGKNKNERKKTRDRDGICTCDRPIPNGGVSKAVRWDPCALANIFPLFLEDKIRGKLYIVPTYIKL